MHTTRRTCLRAAVALASQHTALRALPAGPADSSFDPCIEIRPDYLHHNVREVARRAEARPILAVIKNNGYGLGVVNVARVLEPLPEVTGFAVVKLNEAFQLREAGVRKPVLLMGPFDEQNLVDVVSKNILPMVYTPIGPALDRLSRRLQRPIDLHVCIDTGLGRVGVPHREAGTLIRDLCGWKSVRILGIMMTFTEDPQFDEEQLRRFRELTSSLEADGLRLGRKHAASSFTLFQHPDAFPRYGPTGDGYTRDLFRARVSARGDHGPSSWRRFEDTRGVRQENSEG